MNSAALFVCQGFVECQKATKEKPFIKGVALSYKNHKIRN
jgi:hypothetical protein